MLFYVVSCWIHGVLRSTILCIFVYCACDMNIRYMLIIVRFLLHFGFFILLYCIILFNVALNNIVFSYGILYSCHVISECYVMLQQNTYFHFIVYCITRRYPFHVMLSYNISFCVVPCTMLLYCCSFFIYIHVYVLTYLLTYMSAYMLRYMYTCLCMHVFISTYVVYVYLYRYICCFHCSNGLIVLVLLHAVSVHDS